MSTLPIYVAGARGLLAGEFLRLAVLIERGYDPLAEPSEVVSV